MDTAIIKVSGEGRQSVAKGALDSGANLITEKLASELKLKRIPRETPYADTNGIHTSKHTRV